MKFLSCILVVLFTGIGCQQAPDENDEWVELFDGETLSGWTLIGGDADFYVEDGMIVGNSTLGAPNVFLCTEKEYDDFILEFDVKIDEGINSGMQIRSHVWERDTTTHYLGGNGEISLQSWPAGRVWGYQIEVDPSERAWTGGFYEEGNRGWLVTLEDHEEAQRAFKKGDWNTIRVKAEGNRFQTWVNGVPAVETTDALSGSGFFGLQLHGINNPDLVNKKVWWRNIRTHEL
ncbi:DUF1080 domain-containing protein [bacterium]|nr:DUF1080 domain-containing protein [bacterium]RQV98949.1 MAG: DUF1080 domain-containing protein [bacterium]